MSQHDTLHYTRVTARPCSAIVSTRMRTLSLPRRHIAVRLWFVFLLFAATVAVAEAQQKPNDAMPEPFSEAVVQQLLGTVRNSLVAHNPDKMLSAFGGMRDYNRFAEQVRTFFSLYENFRVYYRVLDVAAEGGPDSTEGVPRGRAVIEMQLQGDNTQNNVPGLTRTGQLHLSFEHLRSGWRISDIDREFFH